MEAHFAPMMTRLRLLAVMEQDAMGIHWRAVDVAHGREVRAHELTGAYAQWRPALSPGYELVVDGGRVFVLGPPAPAPGEIVRRAPRTGLVVGIVVAATLVVIMLAAGAVVLLRGLAAPGNRLAAPPAAASPGPGAVNAGLLGVAPGDCIFSISRAADPTTDLGAQVRSCRTDEGYHRVLSVHRGVPRDDVAEIAESRWDYCDVPADTVFWLIWVSADGEVGTMVCASRWA